MSDYSEMVGKFEGLSEKKRRALLKAMGIKKPQGVAWKEAGFLCNCGFWHQSHRTYQDHFSGPEHIAWKNSSSLVNAVILRFPGRKNETKNDNTGDSGTPAVRGVPKG